MSEHKKSLYEITSENLQLLGRIWDRGGEIDEELDLELQVNQAELSDKLDKYCNLIELFKSEKRRIKERIEDMERIAKVMDNGEKRLNAALMDTIQVLGKDELSGSEYKVSRRKSPPRVVLTVDESELDKEFLKTKLLVDKSAIKDALKKGREINGAHLEQGESLRFSPARRI